MHRAAAKVLRTTVQCTARGLTRTGRRDRVPPPGLYSGLRFYLTVRPNGAALRVRPKPEHAKGEPLQSSMYFRRLGVALASGLVGYGAWYTYQDSNSTAALTKGFASTTSTSGAAKSLPTRDVMVITMDEIYSSKYVGEGPIEKLDNENRQVVEMLSPEQATAKLRRREESYFVNRGQGVTRYDLVQLPSNNPIEDDHAEKIVEMTGLAGTGHGNENPDWMFWGVFDGHSGWTTSARLRQTLIGTVAKELNETCMSFAGKPMPQEALDEAMKTSFKRLDDEIVQQSAIKALKQNNKAAASEILAPAISGSCALLSFYDSSTDILRVACTGDSRAVLGRKLQSGKWTATPLSVDQTGGNAAEEARMRKEHPGEPHVIRNGRVLGGLEPTRAFGDARYKWSREISQRLRETFFAGRQPSPLLKTPPYVTAEPAVTATKIEPGKGDFVVLATDGLWEMLTNEEVVGLVGQWLETQGKSTASSQMESVWGKVFGSSKSGLPVEAPKVTEVDGQRIPIRLQQWGVSPNAKDRFTFRDKNAATHLIRNALGGTNEEQVASLLTLPAPHARRFRDDLTVQVIFFGHGQEKTGQVVINDEATAPAKAKL